MAEYDLSRVFVVGGLRIDASLEHAKRLLRMAESTSDHDDARALAGASLVFAVAHLAYEVELRLIQALAQDEVEAGGQPDKFAIRNQLPPELPARVRLLPTVVKGASFRLDERKEKSAGLLKVLRLRNRLVHQRGEYLIGPLDELKAALVDGVITLTMSLPHDPWKDVQLDCARFAVAAVEEFFAELDRLSEGWAVRESSFFREVPLRY